MRALGNRMQRFKPRFLPLFLLGVSVGLPAGLLALYLILDFAPDGRALLVTIPVALLVGAGIAAALNAYGAVGLDPGGITAANSWGVRARFDWEEIGDCRPVNLLGLRYLRVRANGSRWALWVPSFLVERARFGELLGEYAPASSPLRREFERIGDVRP